MIRRKTMTNAMISIRETAFPFLLLSVVKSRMTGSRREPQYLHREHIRAWLLACSFQNCSKVKLSKRTSARVTCRVGPQDCETPRIPYFLGNRLIDGGQRVYTPAAPFHPPHLGFCKTLQTFHDPEIYFPNCLTN
jgi:hypothetical protein